MAYKGPAGLMEKPDKPEDFVYLPADDGIELYIARDIWEQWDRSTELIVSVQGYGRFRLAITQSPC
jgi:hypothetical protein